MTQRDTLLSPLLRSLFHPLSIIRTACIVRTDWHWKRPANGCLRLHISCSSPLRERMLRDCHSTAWEGAGLVTFPCIPPNTSCMLCRKMLGLPQRPSFLGSWYPLFLLLVPLWALLFGSLSLLKNFPSSSLGLEGAGSGEPSAALCHSFLVSIRFNCPERIHYAWGLWARN